MTMPFGSSWAIVTEATGKIATRNQPIGLYGPGLFARLDAGLPDDLGPLPRFSWQRGDEFRERASDRLHADVVELLAKLRLRETARELALQPLDNRRRCSRRRHQGVPGSRIEAGKSGLRHGRQLWRGGRAMQ